MTVEVRDETATKRYDGWLAGCAVRCEVLARSLSPSLAAEAYTVTLEMVVEEFSHLELRSLRPPASPFVRLWIDDEVGATLKALEDDDELFIEEGHCELRATVARRDHARMGRLRAVMISIAESPVRRMSQLVAGLVDFEVRSPSERLAVAGPLVVVAARGTDVGVGIARLPGIDGAGLRTRVVVARQGGPVFAAVASSVPRGERPRELSLRAAGDWRIGGELPVTARAMLAVAAPQAIVGTETEIVISFRELMTDRARLRAAVECAVELVSPSTDGTPYR